MIIEVLFFGDENGNEIHLKIEFIYKEIQYILKFIAPKT